MQNNILSTAFFRSENILKKEIHKYQIFEDFTNRQIRFWDAEKRENDIMVLLGKKIVKGF